MHINVRKGTFYAYTSQEVLRILTVCVYSDLLILG